MRIAYLENIFQTLADCGISWQLGPQTVADHQAHFRQELRMASYHLMLNRLRATGAVFACNCSRAQIASTTPNRHYPGTCLNKKLSLEAADVSWRINTRNAGMIHVTERGFGIREANVHKLNPFFVIRRRDGLPAYQVASLSDDIEYGITHIVRGEDLFESTVSQLFLSQLIGKTAFEKGVFEHHSLLLKEDGLKLSKSAGDQLLKASNQILFNEQIATLRTAVEALH